MTICSSDRMTNPTTLTPLQTQGFLVGPHPFVVTVLLQENCRRKTESLRDKYSKKRRPSRGNEVGQKDTVRGEAEHFRPVCLLWNHMWAGPRTRNSRPGGKLVWQALDILGKRIIVWLCSNTVFKKCTTPWQHSVWLGPKRSLGGI